MWLLSMKVSWSPEKPFEMVKGVPSSLFHQWLSWLDPTNNGKYPAIHVWMYESFPATVLTPSGTWKDPTWGYGIEED